MIAQALAVRPAAASGSRPWLRFGAAVGGLGLVVHLLYRFGDRLWQALAPLDLATARLTAALVGWSGLEAERAGAVISHPEGFSYEIFYRCTGLVPALFLVVGLLALPGRRGPKAWASAAGVVLLLALNQLRLVSLFWIGVHAPQAFGVVHGVAWEGAMILALLLGWIGWLRWSERSSEPPVGGAGEES